RLGRYFYAIGGNVKAATLSGINTRLYLFLAYVMCGTITAISGIVLAARLGTGEANIGATMPLESIAACGIGGGCLPAGPRRRAPHWHRPERHGSGPHQFVSADRRHRHPADLRRGGRSASAEARREAARLTEDGYGTGNQLRHGRRLRPLPLRGRRGHHALHHA